MSKQISSETLSRHARDQIRRDILAGTWAPGEKLQLAALSQQYETSSTVIREALTWLAGERLVTLKPNRGFFVPELSEQEFIDFTELRCVSEELGIRLALERGDLAWESTVIAAHHTLERTPRRTEGAGAPARVNQDWAQAHQAFHAKLIEACEVPVLIDLTTTLAGVTELYRAWAGSTEGSKRDIEAEHRAILDAVLARDAETAGRLLREHYTTSMRLLLAAGFAGHAKGTPAKPEVRTSASA